MSVTLQQASCLWPSQTLLQAVHWVKVVVEESSLVYRLAKSSVTVAGNSIATSKEGIPMLAKTIRLIRNMTRVLLVLLGVSFESVINLLKNITKTLLVSLGISVTIVNIVLCVSILLVGTLPVLNFLASMDHKGI